VTNIVRKPGSSAVEGRSDNTWAVLSLNRIVLAFFFDVLRRTATSGEGLAILALRLESGSGMLEV
jgi:hypothetical protein